MAQRQPLVGGLSAGWCRRHPWVWARCSHWSIFNLPSELGEVDFEGADDAPNRRPSRVRLATLNPRERRDGDAGALGEIFLRASVCLSQATQGASEGLVCEV